MRRGGRSLLLLLSFLLLLWLLLVLLLLVTIIIVSLAVVKRTEATSWPQVAWTAKTRTKIKPVYLGHPQPLLQ